MADVIPIHRKRREKPAVGKLFLDRYRFLDPLGRGGMGEVWSVVDEKIQRIVALKLLHPNLLQVPGYRARFERECSALTRLEHRNVVRLYDAGTEPQPFMVMQRVIGTTLRDLLRDEGALDWDEAVCYAIQLADGLAAIHRAMLWHRDVKPENIMVDGDGNVYILDLGIARDTAGAPPGATGTTTDRLGSFGYTPPEMVLEKPSDHRGDLYQLGLVLYELLTARKPYSGIDEAKVTEVQAAHAYFAPDPIRAQGRDCPEALEALVLRLLAKDPAQRYQSAHELSADLGRVLRERRSMPAGGAVEPLVQRALVRQTLHQRADVRAEQEARAAQEAAPTRQEDTDPMEERQRETRELEAGFVPQSPASESARALATARGERPRETRELEAGFVPQSPASKSARALTAATEPPASTHRAPAPEERERRTMSLPPGHVPAMLAPSFLARTARATDVQPPPPVMPRLVFHGVRRGAALASLLLVGFAVLVLSVRASRVPAMAPSPAVSASATPAAPPSAAPSPDATMSAAPPPPSASASVVVPARRAVPAVRSTPRPKHTEPMF